MSAAPWYSRWSRRLLAIALLPFLFHSAEAADPEPTAERMMIRAHEARADWDDFSGFSADIVVSTDGAVSEGQMIVTAEGELELKLPDAPHVEWSERRLQSLVNHRQSRADQQEFNVSFADDVKTHPLGRLIEFHDDRLHSVYRIQDDVITEVHRTTGATRFTISVTDVSRNPEGKQLPKSYSVSWWDTETGNLTACDVVRNEWIRVGQWDLPAKLLSVRTEDDGERKVGQITFDNHQLLPRTSDQ